MDPDLNLQEQRQQLQLIRVAEPGSPTFIAAALRLADLVEALDEWIQRKGFLPAEWNHKIA